MKELSNELLISLYRKVKSNKLERDYIKVLQDEISRRKIRLPL
ncbi:sporulation histidine kinase inhibitor Sda [Bacillus sp. FJAT-49754]|uniref:Sporulation histidine kinase inhibitor Sda n=1 Tax=Lederbergia citrea TaxID=2833581 RepID=A0A942Z3I1_9BACI|nr:sporulation histidine kinase inhibitor Sda [Lederbergia citrea]MBS4221385.1 sporulation histidine kinase inhibitor Sda [Lederbergia citrea]